MGVENTTTTSEQIPVIQPVVETGQQLVQPVVDHTEKITRIEERQAQQEEKLSRQLFELEDRLANASGERARQLEEKIAGLEAKLAEQATAPVEATEQAPTDAVELAAPEVEASPAPPEKLRKGMRHRKRARRAAKGGS